VNKPAFKRKYRKCAICEQDRYELLDVHRIVEGQEYSEGNCVVLCANCHRRHHTGLIKIREKRHSSLGYVLIYEINGQEIITLL